MAEYCTLLELADLGINPAAFVDTTAQRRHDAIAKRSDYIDSFLGGRYTLPLLLPTIAPFTPYSGALVRCCAILTSIDLIRNRGVGPDDALELDKEEDRQDAWLAMVAKGLVIVVPEAPVDPTLLAPGAPRVTSDLSRGYSMRPGGPYLNSWPYAYGGRRGPFGGW